MAIEIKSEYWTAAEIGKRVNVGARSATKQCKAGLLPARKVGKTWVMSEAAWQAHLLNAVRSE